MPEKPAPQGITGITISGFKSLREESHIDVRPLTILAGANSSGKSSIMQPLLLMKQTLEMSHAPGTFRLDGENVRFTNVDQFLRFGDRKTYQDFMVSIQRDRDTRLTTRYRKTSKNIEPIETIFESPTLNIRFTNETSSAELINQISVSRNRQVKDVVVDARIERFRCFLDFVVTILGEQDTSTTTKFSSEILVFDGTSQFMSELTHIIHIPGLRGNPQRNYPSSTAMGPEFPATFEYYVAGIISQWQESEHPNLKQMGQDLAHLGLTWKVDAKRLDDTQVELRVGRLPKSKRGGARDMVSIADVGFGVSQVLPVVVALLAAQPGQLVYIEQPEIHLHPRAQVALAAILANAARRGVQVVAETHSALLIQGVQTLVAKQMLDPDQVILHWFTRQDDGTTQITSRELDTLGAYGDWPEDFADVQFETDSAYLDIVEQRRAEDMNGYQEPEMSGD